MKHFIHIALIFFSLLTAACSVPPAGGPPTPTAGEIASLASAIRSLGPGVDPEEAARAARISFTYPVTLAQSYGITDTPYVHNIKVNRGERPRGLCWHWAEDMEARLRGEGFRTLTIHRAIARTFGPFEHSTAIIARKGDPMERGIVLDPWRYGGRLFWTPVTEDRYQWQPRLQYLAAKRQRRLAAGTP